MTYTTLYSQGIFKKVFATQKEINKEKDVKKNREASDARGNKNTATMQQT
jgi:hypothetical protein